MARSVPSYVSNTVVICEGVLGVGKRMLIEFQIDWRIKQPTQLIERSLLKSLI